MSCSLEGYAGYFPIHPSTRLQAWRLKEADKKKQQEQAEQTSESVQS